MSWGSEAEGGDLQSWRGKKMGGADADKKKEKKRELKKRRNVWREKKGFFWEILGEDSAEGELKAWEKIVGVSEGLTPREKEKRWERKNEKGSWKEKFERFWGKQREREKEEKKKKIEV